MTQKDLIQEGNYLMSMTEKHGHHFKDYSFLVFPYAKAYEGFLKQLFKDTKLISHLDYISDHLRLGKLLSPFLIDRLGDRSLYQKIQLKTKDNLAEEIWLTWKIGRNVIFHYFPHNFRKLSYEEALNIIKEVVSAMETAVVKCEVPYLKARQNNIPVKSLY